MAISLTCTVFSFFNDSLEVLLCIASDKCMNYWSLPCGWLMKGENLDTGADRVVRELLGFDITHTEQVKAYRDADRIIFGQSIAIGYFSLINRECISMTSSMIACGAQWFKIKHVPELKQQDGEVLELHLRHLKDAALAEPIAFNLLPESFSLPQLARVYEAVLDTKFDTSNFRNRILKLKILNKLEERGKSSSNRETLQYSFNAEAYEKMRLSGLMLNKWLNILCRK